MRDHLKISLAFSTFRLCIPLMTRRTLFAVAGFVGLCGPLSAQQIEHVSQSDTFVLAQPWQNGGVVETSAAFGQPDVLRTLDGSFLRRPSLTLANGGFFSLADAFGWIETTPPDALPPSSAVEPRRFVRAASPAADSSGKFVNWRPNIDYATGEIGVMYGKSSGKFGREYKSGYIISEIGDDNFHLSVGTFYEQSSGRVPRSGR
jgi:hypothetical protein